MKKQLKKLTEEINDKMNMEMIQTDAFKKYRAYDPEVLEASAMVNKWICLFGEVIDKVESLETEVDDLKRKLEELSTNR